MERLTIDTAELACERVGTGPPTLVFLHEGLGSIELWKGFPQAVASTAGLGGIVYDRRGHGRSSPLVTRRSVRYLHESALEELRLVLERIGIDRPVLIGHSDGATIALIHAGCRPAEALVLIAPHVYVEVAAIEGIERTDRTAETLVARLGRYHDHPNELYVAWRDIWLDASFAEWSIESEIEGLEIPMLLIQGDDDEYGTLDQLDRIERAAAGRVERFVVEGAGHSPHLTHAHQVTRRVVDFLRSL